jgi:hypothetical protein
MPIHRPSGAESLPIRSEQFQGFRNDSSGQASIDIFVKMNGFSESMGDRVSLIKRGVRAMAVVAVLSAGAGTLASPAANASSETAMAWMLVRYYHPANSTTLAQCNADGQYYADGSTGYECKYYPNSYPPHTGQSHYELWVGP